MRVLILQPAALPGQMLTPGVEVEVREDTAAWMIDVGAARAVDAPAPEPPDKPPAPPEPPRAARRKQV